MKTVHVGRLATIALFAPLLLAAGSATPNLNLQPQSRLWLSGTSTVRSFECSAASFETKVNATGSAPVAAVLEANKAVTSAEVRVVAAQLDCRNGTMNEHMLKALKADANPVITFNIASYELIRSADGVNARLNGSLTMGGASKNVVVTSVASDAGDGALRVRGSHVVKMSEWGMKRPSLMLGTMKVGDDVTVHFDLVLKA